MNAMIKERLDELISEGERLHELQKSNKGPWREVVGLIQWFTSCLNLLDRLSVSTNRFVIEFEKNCKDGALGTVNQSGALGVLKAARVEYSRGLAVDYHLSVASAVFGDLIGQAEYLIDRGYLRPAVVLFGAALEEALRSRARASNVDVPARTTMTPLLHKLKAPEVGIISDYESRLLEAVIKMRNDAAHGEPFDYTKEQVVQACGTAHATINRVLGER